MKPLYYWVDAEKFVFASEIKSILEYLSLPHELDMDGFNKVWILLTFQIWYDVCFDGSGT